MFINTIFTNKVRFMLVKCSNFQKLMRHKNSINSNKDVIKHHTLIDNRTLDKQIHRDKQLLLPLWFII